VKTAKLWYVTSSTLVKKYQNFKRNILSHKKAAISSNQTYVASNETLILTYEVKILKSLCEAHTE